MVVKKKLANISSASCLIMAFLLTSCGIIDMEFDENVQDVYDMQLDHDTVYVTQGDSFAPPIIATCGFGGFSTIG